MNVKIYLFWCFCCSVCTYDSNTYCNVCLPWCLFHLLLRGSLQFHHTLSLLECNVLTQGRPTLPGNIHDNYFLWKRETSIIEGYVSNTPKNLFPKRCPKHLHSSLLSLHFTILCENLPFDYSSQQKHQLQ